MTNSDLVLLTLVGQEDHACPCTQSHLEVQEFQDTLGHLEHLTHTDIGP